MKTSWLTIALLVFAVSRIQGQVSQSGPPAIAGQGTVSVQDTPYAVVDRGANHRVWQRTTYETRPDGKQIPHIHKYTELATGLNYQDKSGNWLESEEEIELVGGGAAATQGQHKVYFPADIYNGVLEVVTPDGRHLKSRPLGVSYDDGNNAVFIATLKHSQGLLTRSNQVTYPDAFTDFTADLVCTYRRSGFECDLVFRQQPPTPDQYGLDNSFSTLQLVTEFFNTADPQQIPAQTDDWFGLQDTTLKFGSLTMTRGKVFAVGNPRLSDVRGQGEGNVSVYKRWLHIQGRTFLIEEVPLVYLADDLSTLPDATNSLSSKVTGAVRMTSNHRQMPPSHEFVSDTNQMRIASIDLNKQPGVVLDYVTLIIHETNFVFQGRTTYYISGPTLLFNTNTIQGGAVIKFAHNTQYVSGAQIFLIGSGIINYPISADNPAVLTAKDDDSVGETISGSTGNPNNYYASVALSVFASSPKNLRISYASTGIGFTLDDYNPDPVTISDCQFINCNTAINIQTDPSDGGWGVATFKNVLIYNSTYAVVGYTYELHGENLTVHNCNQLMYGLDPEDMALITYNSLFVAVTNRGVIENEWDDQSVWVGSDTDVFEAAGAASHYLAASSSYRDVGTTDIDPDLLAEIQQMTTYAPQDGGFPDTNTPDLGYHYPVTEDSDNDGLPDWWEWKYFGTYSLGGTNLDSTGVNTLLDDYNSQTDPNVIQFTIEVSNNYVNTTNAAMQLNILGGVPFYKTVLVDSTNFTGATWTNYASPNLTVNLGTNEGWHEIWVGLRGLPADTQQTWGWKRLKLDTSPPQLVVINPTNSTVNVPMIQLQGYSPEALESISYDITNASGLANNQDAGITQQYYSTNTYEFTTNYFECIDILLTNGVNTITLHATDLAGNTTTTNFNFTLDYSSRTNPPAIQLFWPQNGEQISGSNFTWRGWVDDPTATVSAQIVSTNGNTNTVNGLVERNGNFWVENLPMPNGTNSLTLTVTDSAGNTSTTNISVSTNPLTVTMTPVPANQLWYKWVTAGGTISDSTYSLWINGVKAVVASGNWTATHVPMTEGGTAIFNITTYAPGETQPDGSHGN